MNNETADVVVIGGGTAGLAAARAARRRDLSVTLIDATRLGGECLWWTCLPTKMLIESAHNFYYGTQTARLAGESTADKLDFPRIQAERNVAMAHFTAQISATQLADEGINYIHGRGSFLSAHEVKVGEQILYAGNIVIAVGARPIIPPIPGIEQIKYLTYMHAINLPKVPKSLVIIGGGPVGCEFAQIFRRFAADVTIVERFPLLLNQDDLDISHLARRVLEGEGVRIFTETTVIGVKTLEDKKVVSVNVEGDEKQLSCEEVLVVTGRRPQLDGLNLEAAAVHLEQGHIVLRDTLQTSQPHIWVCGDAAGRAQFKHLAELQGEHIGNNIGLLTPQSIDERVIPHSTFLDPEMAGVGLTEEQAATNYDTVVATLPLNRSDRAMLMRQAQGFIKLIVNRSDGQILGGHIAGPFAGDVIHEIALAMLAHVPIAKLAALPRIYPSVYEPLARVAREAHLQCLIPSK